jgi:glycosyltransferase involved in cell wall biosynthesis
MATFNGDKYLRHQLDSIIFQRYNDWQIVISDDGSTDETIPIINEYQAKYNNKIILKNGPKKGVTENFIYLLNLDYDTEYYAFADQDDIWDEYKLYEAISVLKKLPENKPTLYCGATILINDLGKIIGKRSYTDFKNLSFSGALGFIVATGNTMVFNAKTKKIFTKEMQDGNLVGHDWLVYLYVSALDGIVFYDTNPLVSYRIHENNISGIKIGFLNRLNSLYKWIFRDGLALTNKRIENSLFIIHDQISKKNLLVFNYFLAIRHGEIRTRVISLYKSKIRRRNSSTNIILYISALFNKY